MSWWRKNWFFRLLENIKIGNKQENAGSDWQIHEYAEKDREKAIEYRCWIKKNRVEQEDNRNVIEIGWPL